MSAIMLLLASAAAACALVSWGIHCECEAEITSARKRWEVAPLGVFLASGFASLFSYAFGLAACALLIKGVV
jgi:presenilin-like A22 family membrane protease